MESEFPSRLRLLSTSFRYAETRFFYGRADLYFDRIELLGWGGGRTGKRIMPLSTIDRIEFGQADGSADFTAFTLSNGERVELCLRKPRAWKKQLTSRLDWRSRLEKRGGLSPDAEWSMKDIINYSTSMS